MPAASHALAIVLALLLPLSILGVAAFALRRCVKLGID